MKKIIKYAVFAILALAFVLVMAACGGKDKLDAPTAIYRNIYENKITWKGDPLADRYFVEINDEIFYAYEPEYVIDAENSGEITVRVKVESGAGDRADSDWSKRYTIPSYQVLLQEVENGEGYEVSGYVGTVKGRLDLPDTYNGKKIVSIGEKAFYFCNLLTGITIPDSVTNIGEHAFCDCSSLKDISLPQGITVLSKGIFGGCSSLTEITIPDSVTEIRDSAFARCTSLKEITVPGGVTLIAYNVFCGCTSLERVVLNSGVSEISGIAFRDCTSLKSINIPDSVTKIRMHAFRNCTSLESITIPGSVYLEREVFEGCTSLESAELLDGVKMIPADAFYDCSSLKNVILPSSLEIIGDGAFGNCTSLEGITIPDTVTAIYNAFYRSGLKSIFIPRGVTEIKSEAFDRCESLVKMSVAADNAVFSSKNNCILDKAGNVLMFSCRGSVIPECVTMIGNHAYACNDQIKELIIPPQITEIGQGAYRYCKYLNRVFVPKTVRKIGPGAFDVLVIYNLFSYYVPEHAPRTVTLDKGVWVKHLFDDHTCRRWYSGDKYDLEEKCWVCALDYDMEYYPYVTSIDLYDNFDRKCKPDLIGLVFDRDYYPTRMEYYCDGFSLTPDGSVLTDKDEVNQIYDRVLNGKERIMLYPIWRPIERV